MFCWLRRWCTSWLAPLRIFSLCLLERVGYVVCCTIFVTSVASSLKKKKEKRAQLQPEECTSGFNHSCEGAMLSQSTAQMDGMSRSSRIESIIEESDAKRRLALPSMLGNQGESLRVVCVRVGEASRSRCISGVTAHNGRKDNTHVGVVVEVFGLEQLSQWLRSRGFLVVRPAHLSTRICSVKFARKTHKWRCWRQHVLITLHRWRTSGVPPPTRIIGSRGVVSRAIPTTSPSSSWNRWMR